MSKSKKTQNTFDRREFIQAASAAVAATAVCTGKAEAAEQSLPTSHYGDAASQTEPDTKVVHSVCLGCNARCGNRQIVKNGKLEKISGNPYHPYNTMGNPIDYSTPVTDSLPVSSPVCGKAHDAVGYVYNQRRIRRPLKRAGARGEGKFEEISWNQLIKEVGQGGKIFSNLGEDRHVAGLGGCLSDDPIDPNDPYLGSKRNGFTFMTGRLQSGRKEFIDRFVKSAAGSINRIGHTDICGLGFRMGNYSMTEGKQVELKADPWGAEYILVFGANIYEALQPGLNTYGAAIAKRYSQKAVKFAIVDPRAQNAAVHAHDWIPVIPGQDGAFAMAMIRWMIENNRINTEYLTLPNLEAAGKKAFSAYSNATHLVIDDEDHPNNGKFLRLSDISSEKPEDGDDPYMIQNAAGLVKSYTSADRGTLEAEFSVTGADSRNIKVATSFSLMKQAVMAKSLDEYSALCGISAEQIIKTGRDFTSHGTKAAVCQYHGAGNYTNGTYGAFSVALLSVLIGSIGMKGGYLTGGGAAASWKKGKYDLSSFHGKHKTTGVKNSREKAQYEKTNEYKSKKQKTGSGYPAKRPWPTFTKGGLSVEALNGIDQGYPYQCQTLMTYFYNPVYSTPGGYRYIETLKSAEKVPLHISIDIGINESNVYADYIVPDVTYLEGQYGWLNPHAPALRFTGIRIPAIEALTDKTDDNRPYSLETFLIDLAISLNMPGFGENAIQDQNGSTYPLYCAEDFYLRAYANIAAAAKLPIATKKDIEFVEKNYPLAQYKDMVSEPEWQQLCYMLARGGVFQPYDSVFDNDTFKHGIERVVLYNEKLATTKNSLTGEQYSGTLQYLTPQDSKGDDLAEKDKGFPFLVVTHKMHVHTQSRTTWHKYTMELFPTNYVQINRADGEKLGLKDGDSILLHSASNKNGISGLVELVETVRPGCLAISFHYGHSQLGASPLQIDGGENVFLGGKEVYQNGKMIAQPTLGAGTNPNMVGRLDEHLANTPLVDVLAGIPDFSSTRVQVTKTS